MATLAGNSGLGSERIVKTKVQFLKGPEMLHSEASCLRLIAFIEDVVIIQMILKHLGLWETRHHDPPRETAIKTTELIYTDQYAQIPFDDHWVK